MYVNKYKKFVRETVDRRTLLEQLAEECCELSQAALKLVRAEGLSNNPTPVSRDEALMSLREEFQDVVACFSLVADEKRCDFEDGNPKWKRWATRLGYKELEND